jgi:agmatine deiminase
VRRLPAEWEPHAATWLAWPHNRKDWPGKFAPIPLVYAEIIRHLGRHERVELIVDDAGAEAKARRLLVRAGAMSGNVRFHHWPTDRIWVRDSGCTFIQDGPGLGAVCWRFTAWAKYPDFQRDELIGRHMAEAAGAGALQAQQDGRRVVLEGCTGRFGHVPADQLVALEVGILGPGGEAPAHRAQAQQDGRRVVLEGGSIDGNGRGTLLTTEECLLSEVQQRNPGLGRAEYERLFAEHLGITRVIWLERGVAGDDTHGHVDDISRFVAADTVVTVVEPDPAQPNHAPLQENLRRLRAARDQDGRPLRVVELPMPGPVRFGGVVLPASYGNFYLANGLVLVPVFNDRNDRLALNILAELFPDREVVGIYAGDLVLGFGALHCLTQQQPA